MTLDIPSSALLCDGQLITIIGIPLTCGGTNWSSFANIPAYSASDYAHQFGALFPMGRAWPREDGSAFQATIAALSPTYARNHARAAFLLVDAFPSTTVELLPEWEATLGLPDPCAGPASTIQQRRAQVVARFVGNGGQSPAYFVQFAANLGYAITITESVRARFGVTTFGQPMNGDAWSHTWQVNAPATTVFVAKFGVAQFGEPYRAWGNAVLECEMQAIKPAHTILQFIYA
jgi:uncharacterized protein YmfQ (DUF2313 family)